MDRLRKMDREKNASFFLASIVLITCYVVICQAEFIYEVERATKVVLGKLQLIFFSVKYFEVLYLYFIFQKQKKLSTNTIAFVRRRPHD